MDDPALSVFSEARHEYMKQLGLNLRQPFLQFFLEQFQIARDEMRDTPKKYLWQFQNRLRAIKEWNVDKVQHEIKRIEIASNCDFLEELITAVFIAHTKVMTAIRITSRKNKINITVPKLEHYLFKALCECSDLLWANIYLFRDDISAIDKQKNIRQVETLIIEGMQQAIRCLLPIKSILRDLVPDEDDEVDAEVAEVAEAAEATEVAEAEETTDKDTKEVTGSSHKGEMTINKLSAEASGIMKEEPIFLSAEPVALEPVALEPATLEPATLEPATLEPATLEPATLEPATPEPATLEPATLEPATLEPTTLEPATPEPVALEVITPAPALVTTPPILQVNTSKQVQFSDYNMGFVNEDDTNAFVEPMDDTTFIIMDEADLPIDDGDFETL